MPTLIAVVTPYRAKNKFVSVVWQSQLLDASSCVCMGVNILGWLHASSSWAPSKQQQGLLTLGFVVEPLFFLKLLLFVRQSQGLSLDLIHLGSALEALGRYRGLEWQCEISQKDGACRNKEQECLTGETRCLYLIWMLYKRQSQSFLCSRRLDTKWISICAVSGPLSWNALAGWQHLVLLQITS